MTGALTPDDFAEPMELLIQRDRPGAIACLLRNVLMAFGSPAVGSAAGAAVENAAQALADTATKRFLDAGGRWDRRPVD